jgi:hypothetical protein
VKSAGGEAGGDVIIWATNTRRHQPKYLDSVRTRIQPIGINNWSLLISLCVDNQRPRVSKHLRPEVQRASVKMSTRRPDLWRSSPFMPCLMNTLLLSNNILTPSISQPTTFPSDYRGIRWKSSIWSIGIYTALQRRHETISTIPVDQPIGRYD